nr:COBRA-like protein 1 [Ipomoea batatas]
MLQVAVLLERGQAFAYCYDPLDPNGNITVRFDVLQWTADGYLARITIQNYYQYRQVQKPGWKLGWTWANDEVIWSMSGAFATQQGNCSKFTNEIPHSCKIDPVIADLMPEALPENRSDDCCHGGFLSAWAVSPSNSFSSFKMKVGNLRGNYTAFKPLNLSLMAPGPGYTCAKFVDTDPTVSPAIGGRREEQVFIHWHIKNNYRDHWRVKLTISNYNYGRNYSDWTLVVQHPGFSQTTTTYSFNSTVLPTAGVPDEIALFWGIDFYNTILLQASEEQVGSVTTEILLGKDLNSFTLSNGWAFPRRIYFNGENCEMPPPDTFPMLPNGNSSLKPGYTLVLICLIYKMLFAMF